MNKMKTTITIAALIFICLSISAQDKWDIINAGITEDLHDIEFINDSTGFIYSYGTGKIYRTTDGGSNWAIIKHTDSIYYEQIQFVNANSGWICGEHGRLLKTDDSGESWTDIRIESENKNLLLYGLNFMDEAVGYLSGAALKDRKFHPVTFISKDGGITWNKTLKDFPHMILNIEQKDNELFGCGNGFIIKINPQNHTWKYVFQDTLKVIGQIRDIEFADKKFGMAISFNGKVLISDDGGESFSYQEITSNRLRSIAYTGGTEWIAVGDNNKDDGAVMHTSADNGKSWKKNNEFPDIHRIHLTKSNIWIVGKKGLIAKRKR